VSAPARYAPVGPAPVRYVPVGYPPVRSAAGRYAKRHHRECRGGRCEDEVTVANDVHGDEHDRHGKEQQRRQSHKSQATICHRYGRCARVHRCDQSGFNTDTVQRIVSLVLSTSNGTDANSIFVLNASNNIRTQVYLVPVNSTSSNNTGGPIEVYQKLPIFVATSASVQPYCAAFDPSPAAPAPLTVMRRSDVDSVYESQKFLYNPLTGVIHPDWIQAPPLSSSSNPCPTPSTMTRIKDFTSAMTASATTFAAEALQTGPSDWFATAALA